jgi:hypothetical protein
MALFIAELFVLPIGTLAWSGNILHQLAHGQSIEAFLMNLQMFQLRQLDGL